MTERSSARSWNNGPKSPPKQRSAATAATTRLVKHHLGDVVASSEARRKARDEVPRDSTQKATYETLMEQVVTKENAGTREIYEPALEKGTLSFIPDYLNSMLEFLKGTGSADVQTDVTAITPLLAAKGLVALDPAPAQNRNEFAVTKATAEHAKIAEPKNLSAPIIMLKLFHKCRKVSYSRCHASRSRPARDSCLSPLQDAGHARQERSRAEVRNV